MWSGQHSVCICLAIAFTLLSLPSTLECCSLSTTEIIMIMSRNPNYGSDPCYIQWQAAENEKLAHVWAQRRKLEESIREAVRKQKEKDARMSQNREPENQQRISTESKAGTAQVIGYLAIVGVLMAMLCCVMCVVTAQNDDENGTTTTVPPSNLHQNESPTNQLTSTLPSNLLGNRTVFASTSNDNELGGFESVTFIPLKVPRRKDSLPSYEDACSENVFSTVSGITLHE